MTESLARWACPCGKTSLRATRVDGPLHCPACERALQRQTTVAQVRATEGADSTARDAIDRAWHQVRCDGSDTNLTVTDGG
jgi:hypothetical protein